MENEKIKTKSRIVMMSLIRIVMDFAEKEQHNELYNSCVDATNYLIGMKNRD